MFKRLYICAILLCCLSQVNAQSRLTQTLDSYSEAQKRLLARNIGRFLYMVSQGQWDLDSSVQYACRRYGLNRQFPYDEMIYDGSIREPIQWLDQREVSKAIAAADGSTGDKKIRLLLELAIYYLHQTGTLPAQLDSAAAFITAARKAAIGPGFEKWKKECDALQGELLYQQGHAAESVPYFATVANSFPIKDISARKAMAIHEWALHLPFNDTSRISYLEKSFDLYQQLGLKEHGIEVMSDIVTAYFMFDWKAASQKLKEVLALEQAAGYRHTMDTYYVLAYIGTMSGNYINSIVYADSSMAMATQTGDSLLYSMTCFRLGTLYDKLQENERAMQLFRKGMERMHREPIIFWSGNFFGLAGVLTELNKPAEALALLQSTTKEYPFEGVVANTYLALCYADCYDRLGQTQQAEKYYNQVIANLEKYPQEHRHVDAANFNMSIGQFYTDHKQYAKARPFLEKALQYSRGKEYMHHVAYTYLYLSKLDSVDGNYANALANYKQYKLFYDSFVSISQRFKVEELNVQYETSKKDKDIALARSDLQQARLSRNIVIAGLVLLALIAALLYNQYRIKKKNARAIEQKNIALEQLVDEKQWLLKEVHHRVKNSLQTIVSLLELQTEYLRDPMAAIQDSQNRIFATSLLHQKLYQDDNLSSVNMRLYLPELILYLQDAFQTRSKIHFMINVESIDLDISQAVPIGIITNEVITNAIKYAFPDNGVPGEIRVTLSMIDANTAELLIADNGKGFPPGAFEEKSAGLGLNLVRGLTEDLNGTVQFITGKGATISVRFNPRPALTHRPNRAAVNQQYEENPYN